MHTPTPATLSSNPATADSPATPRALSAASLEFTGTTPISGGLTPKGPISAVPPPQVNLTPASPLFEPQPATTSAKTSSGFSLPRMKFPKRSNSSGIVPTLSSSPSPSPSPTPPSTAGAEAEKKSRFRKSWGSSNRAGPSGSSEGSAGSDESSRRRRKKEKEAFSLSGANDIVGIVMLDIKNAVDLPRLRNSKRKYPVDGDDNSPH